MGGEHLPVAPAYNYQRLWSLIILDLLILTPLQFQFSTCFTSCPVPLADDRCRRKIRAKLLFNSETMATTQHSHRGMSPKKSCSLNGRRTGETREGLMADTRLNPNMKFNRSGSRKSFLMKACIACLSGTGMSPESVKAACLAGDTASSCIGVYKMPIDDNALPYVDTPETLRKFAPDVNWVAPIVPPKSYPVANKEMRELQTRCLELQGLISGGMLESAGKELLAILPRITVCGRVMIQALADAKATSDVRRSNGGKVVGSDFSMRALRAEVHFDELLFTLAQCDILIGQALRGELGAPAAAQIQILGLLKESETQFDEFFVAIP